MNKDTDNWAGSRHHRNFRIIARCSAITLFVVLTTFASQPNEASSTLSARDDAYLGWSAQQAQSIWKAMRVTGRVGSALGFRGLHTERAAKYKIRATWLTPDVIRAAARFEQIRSRLSDEATKALVREAEAVGDTVIMVEIDPNEGSGVIPLEWQAFLQPISTKNERPWTSTGVSMPRLRELKALNGVVPRDYDYDVFWMVFPLTIDSGKALFSEADREAELVIRIYDKEGKVSWRIAECIREVTKRISSMRSISMFVQ